MPGWISIHRKMMEGKSYFSEPFCRNMAWIDLILLANHDENYIIVRGIRVDIKRGQIGYTSENLAKRWKWSRGKVLRYLLILQKDNQIVQQKNNVTTLISIINYNKYQDAVQQYIRKTVQQTVQQIVQQTDINNNDNNANKEIQLVKIIEKKLNFSENGKQSGSEQSSNNYEQGATPLLNRLAKRRNKTKPD